LRLIVNVERDTSFRHESRLDEKVHTHGA